MAQTPRKTTSKRRKWLLVLAAAFAPFALIEIGLRVFHDARLLQRDELAVAKPHNTEVLARVFRYDSDEEVRYALQPSLKIEDSGAIYHTNSLGLRGPEVSQEKSTGEKRILVLGDSYAFGLGVDQDGIITAALERQLAERPGSIHALNMGVPGYHTGQQLARLNREGFALDPDLVVLFYCPNDEVQEAFQYDPVIGVLYGDTLPVPYSLKYFLRRSATYSFIADRVARAQLESGELKAMMPHQWAPTRDRLVTLFEACRDRKTPLLLINLPTLFNTKQLVDPEFEYHKNYDRIGELATEHGVPWVDIRARLRKELETIKAVEFLYVSTDPLDPHLNARGYEIVAGSVIEKIDELGLLR